MEHLLILDPLGLGAILVILAVVLGTSLTAAATSFVAGITQNRLCKDLYMVTMMGAAISGFLAAYLLSLGWHWMILIVSIPGGPFLVISGSYLLDRLLRFFLCMEKKRDAWVARLSERRRKCAE